MPDTDTTDAPDVENNTEENDSTDEAEPETFDHNYVAKLRAEAAEHRVKAKRADDLQLRLLAATVEQATAGILADATDLPAEGDYLDDDGYPDPEKIKTAATELVNRKPHLGDRRPTGTVDQGAREDASTVDLAGTLRRLAG